jgi:gluconolactonase
VPETVSHVCFRGRAKARLFMTGTTSLDSIFLNRNGMQKP